MRLRYKKGQDYVYKGERVITRGYFFFGPQNEKVVIPTTDHSKKSWEIATIAKVLFEEAGCSNHVSGMDEILIIKKRNHLNRCYITEARVISKTRTSIILRENLNESVWYNIPQDFIIKAKDIVDSKQNLKKKEKRLKKLTFRNNERIRKVGINKNKND